MNTVLMCYPGGKYKCLTMSCDDGMKEDIRLVELFNRQGIKGTFHLNAGSAQTDPNRIRLSDFASVYFGHEIACHTATHPTISRCPIPSVAEQIMQDRRALEAAAGYPVRGMSYPNGSHSPDIRELLRFTGIDYSRVVGDSFSFGMPEDFTQWKPTCHHNNQLMDTGRRFLDAAKSQYLHLMYVWGHSWEFARKGDWTPVDNWSLIEEFCQMAGGRDDVWYATNIEIYDCVQVFSRLQFSLDNSFVYNPSAASGWLRTHPRISVGSLHRLFRRLSVAVPVSVALLRLPPRSLMHRKIQRNLPHANSWIGS